MQRHTRQRAAILAAFEQAGRPLAPAEVRRAAAGGASSLGMATVYRAIHQLLEDGWLVAVDLPGESARYEVSGKRHHHHFQCRQCGKVYEVPGCLKDVGALTPRGFRVTGHEVVLYGKCSACLRGWR